MRELSDEELGSISFLLTNIEESVSDIRDDWSDPRGECRDILACVKRLRLLLLLE